VGKVQILSFNFTKAFNEKTRMIKLLTGLLLVVTLAAFAEARERPAPQPSRYTYTLPIDEKSLPEGVTARVLRNEHGVRTFIKNSSDTPLVIDAIYSNDRLVSGKQLVNGKVFGWFPNGVPMQGKQHLKGWQAPFGDISEANIRLPRDPAKIYEGRKPGLDETVPAPEATIINTIYDDKPYEIKATITYHLNPAYEAKP